MEGFSLYLPAGVFSLPICINPFKKVPVVSITLDDLISLPDSVDASVRAKRSKLLRLLSSRKKATFYERNVGSIQDVLFESEEKDGFIEGFSSNYIRFRRPWDPNLIE